MTDLQKLLIKHEGIRLKPYKCPVGKLTIGVGRNIEDNGITYDEALFMLDRDIKAAQAEIVAKYDWFQYLDQVRKDVVLSMVFNMGLPRFAGFQKFIRYLERRQFGLAAEEMLDSQWATQVGARAQELSKMMATGAY